MGAEDWCLWCDTESGRPLPECWCSPACLAFYTIAIIVVAAKRRRFDLVLASIGYAMCLGFCVLAWVVMLEFEVFD